MREPQPSLSRVVAPRPLPFIGPPRADQEAVTVATRVGLGRPFEARVLIPFTGDTSQDNVSGRQALGRRDTRIK